MNISDILILGPEILLIIYALMSILFASFSSMKVLITLFSIVQFLCF